jgi:ceramide glucosyltransferase
MSLLDTILLGAVVFAAVYQISVWACVALFARQRPPQPRHSPAVTVLKPLRGDDGHLYDNLRSFCEQDYPHFELLFGIRNRHDPAAAIVRRLQHEFPRLDIGLVCDGRVIGTNPKASNLANLVRHAKYGTLIMADGDMRVAPDYIRTVAAALDDDTVGLVTCLYYGVARGGLASRLSAMFINEWLLPAALVGTRLERLRHAFGATIACRRDTLRSIGGIESVADRLADDYMLGWLVSRRGLRVVLAPHLVENVIAEPDVRTLFRHELRWARTFRTVRPLSYFCALFTHGVSLSLLWLAVGSAGGLAAAALVVHITLRCFGRVIVHRSLGRPVPWAEMWLVPVRDVASFVIGIASFLGRTVHWNGERFRVSPDGRLEPERPARAGTRRVRRAASATIAAPKAEERT